MIGMYRLASESAPSMFKGLLNAQATFPFNNVVVASDKGPNFVAELIQEEVKILGGFSKFGITNSHTDQADIESANARMRELIRPYMNMLALKTDGDEVDYAAPLVVHTLNNMEDPVTGLSPYDLAYPLASSKFPMVSLPDGQLPSSALASLLFRIQNEWLSELWELHKTKLSEIKYKDKVDDYPKEGDLVAMKYEVRPGKRHYRNYGPFIVVETIEREGNPYVVMKDLNDLMREPITRAMRECVKYSHDPRNMSPAEVASSGSDYSIVLMITGHHGVASKKKDMKFDVGWLGGAVTQEPYDNVKHCEALDRYIIDLAASGDKTLVPMLDKQQRELIERQTRGELNQVVATWKPQLEPMYVDKPVGVSVSDLQVGDDPMALMKFVENDNTPEQMLRLN
jgi:hypothetical protein